MIDARKDFEIVINKSYVYVEGYGVLFITAMSDLKFSSCYKVCSNMRCISS